MSFIELFLIGVGLSMDAFAAAICQGLSMTRIKWIAFILLVLIGGNMIREALSGDEEDAAQAETDLRLDHKKLFLMAIATSIDALAIGVTFAFLETAILPAIGIIGCTTFCISVAGVAVGCWFGARYKKRAEITGGAILVLLGIKILLEHLGILAF